MRYWIVAGLITLLSVPCSAQEVFRQRELVDTIGDKTYEVVGLFNEGRLREGIAILEQLAARPNADRLEGYWETLLYNLACGHSLLGNLDTAVFYLKQAVESGYEDLEFLQQDPDLDRIREHPGFQEILRQLQARQLFWENPFLNSPYRKNISEEEKQAGLAKLWSEIKYNFAFFGNVPELNWDSVYLAHIPQIEKTKSTLEYYRVLQRMCALLQDGHTNINYPAEIWPELWALPPIRTRLVEGKVVITEVLDPDLLLEGIFPGREVVRVNRMPVHQYAEQRVQPWFSASTPQALAEKVYYFGLLAGPHGSKVRLGLKDENGRTFGWALPRTYPSTPLATFLEYKEVDGRFGYLVMNSFSEQFLIGHFDSLFSSLEQHDALIIDLRENGGGNSGVAFDILGYLTDRPFPTIRWRTQYYRPTYRAWGIGQPWHVEPPVEDPPHGTKLYDKPVVVLIGPQTESAAEEFCVAFDYMRRGVLIGRPTGGSTGQPLVFNLPGGGSARVCTSDCTYPDGKKFVGVGIQPDIVVPLTLEDIHENRDAVLLRSVEYLRKMLGE